MTSKIKLRNISAVLNQSLSRLIKKLHKMVLEAKALTRKRTELMTREELFKLSQERQKSLKYNT